jgi:anti-sigma factor RsiW
MSVPPYEGSHVQMLLGAYVLGGLTPEEDRLVAAHLQGCDECGAEYLEMAEASALLAGFSESDLLEGLSGAGDDFPQDSGNA